MPKFEEGLWSDLLTAHGAQLATATSPRREHKRALLPLAATGFTIAAIAIVLVLSLSAKTATPAYAVTRNSDGTVTITINELAGISQANEQLAKLGVRARARPGRVSVAGCKVSSLFPSNQVMDPIMRFLHPSRSPFAIRIDPRMIPPGTTLLISARLMSVPHPRVPLRGLPAGRPVRAAALGILLARDPVPACALSQ